MLARLRHSVQHVLARLPALIPTCCALCGQNNPTTICDGCRTQFFKHGLHRCSQCAVPLPHISPATATKCGACLKQPPAFDATIVATDYAAPIDRLIWGLKFGGQLALAPLFAQMLRDALLQQAQIPLPIRLTAVPLGTQRLAERGFNQALEIARPLSQALGIPLDWRLLARVRETQAQALLAPDQRHHNMRHAFIIRADALERVQGCHIGVVDDVMTTGETLNELAQTLKRFGAIRVTNFVFARTLQK